MGNFAVNYRGIFVSAALTALWLAGAAATAQTPPATPSPSPNASLPEQPKSRLIPVKPEIIRPESELGTWWHDKLPSPVGPPEAALPMEMESALVQAIGRSARVEVLRHTALISATAVPQAQANFDPIAFLDTRFTNTSDPVGSSLTTGGSSRFRDKAWYSSGGIRRQALTGAQLEVAQRIGYENTNSTFFVPKDQATAKLTMNVSQPLLRGAGYAYNNGVIVLATLDVNIAQAQFCTDLQTYLVDFHSAFWDIYARRAILLQQRRLLQEAKDILKELELRRDVDVQVSQLSRAKAAVANREAGLLRYEAAVKDSVARFKALVNDPYLENPAITELIPLDSPDAGYGETDVTSALTTALDHRSEIQEAIQEARSAAQRLDIAKNEVLPALNLVVGSYIYGLQGQSQFAQAYGDQFSVGRPTYWAGLVFERPIGNRGPRAVQDQRVLELQRATGQLRAVTASVHADVEIAVREIATTRGEMISRHQQMLAEQEQVDVLLQRWRLLPGDQQVAGVVFNDLLDAQVRRATAELDFVTSQVAHRLAWIKLRRATGTLCDCCAVTAQDVAASISPPPAEPGPPAGEAIPAPAAPQAAAPSLPAAPSSPIDLRELPLITPLPAVESDN